MGKTGRTGIRRILFAAGYSARGLAAALRGEAAFRQEAVLAAVAVPLGLWLGATGAERALLVAAALQVLVVELLNSAVESAVDRVGEAEHPLAGRAKDMGSAAVLLSLVLAVVVWVLVLLG